MQTLVYSVYDRKAQAYGRPFIMQNSAMATRAFMHACSDPNTDVGMCPEDYSLRLIGEFDDETGKITNCEPAIIVEGPPVSYFNRKPLNIVDDVTNYERN